jgi:hypothetical protein
MKWGAVGILASASKRFQSMVAQLARLGVLSLSRPTRLGHPTRLQAKPHCRSTSLDVCYGIDACHNISSWTCNWGLHPIAREIPVYSLLLLEIWRLRSAGPRLAPSSVEAASDSCSQSALHVPRIAPDPVFHYASHNWRKPNKSCHPRAT